MRFQNGYKMEITEAQKISEDELKIAIQKHQSAKQSLNRMSARLRKLCKKLTPTNEIVHEMQKIASEIREMVKEVT